MKEVFSRDPPVYAKPTSAPAPARPTPPAYGSGSYTQPPGYPGAGGAQPPPYKEPPRRDESDNYRTTIGTKMKVCLPKSCRIWLHALCLAVRNWHLACALAPAELSFVKKWIAPSNKKRMSALLSHTWSARKRKCRRSSRSSPPRKCSLSRVAQQPTARLVRPFLC